MKDKNDKIIKDMNDETPDNFTRFGDGHKLKVETKYTDGEPPAEDEEADADPEHPLKERPPKKYI